MRTEAILMLIACPGTNMVSYIVQSNRVMLQAGSQSLGVTELFQGIDIMIQGGNDLSPHVFFF